jgi:hypothetical protein
MPCERCGASVETRAPDEHACDDRRRHDFELFALRAEVDAFGDELGRWLGTPRGRFAQFYAERTRPS